MADRRVTIGLFGDDRDLEQKIRDAKLKLDKLKSQQAKVPLTADDKQLLVKIKEAELKLKELSAKKADPEVDLKGYEKTSLQIDKLDLKLDHLAVKSAGGVGKSFTQLGSDMGALSNYAIPVLIAGLVGISGQLITVGFGLGAFGIAVLKDVEPIFKASRRVGGLAANMDRLDPTQRKLALSLLGLGQDYSKFAASVKPEVFSSFNKALLLADDLMKDTSPIAKEAGKAFSFVLGQIDEEFQSGTWQNFFGFMKKEAGPDIRQLGQLFTDLLQAIPPLAEALHPLGTVLINDLDDITKFLGGIGQLSVGIEGAVNKINHTMEGIGKAGGQGSHFNLLDAAKNALNEIMPALPAGKAIVGWIEKLGQGSDKAASGQRHLATAAQAAAQAAAQEQRNLDALSASIGKAASQILDLQGDEVSWRQAQNDATKALNQNKGALKGNSDAALQDKAALLQSTNQAIAFAQRQAQIPGHVGKANQILNAQIQYLETHAGKSKFAQQEILALIKAEYAIPHSISSTIHAKTAAAAAALAAIMNRMAQLNGMTSTVFVDYSVGGQSYVVPHHRHVGNQASGTPSAPPGWSWVGEKGPELIKMKGGEVVIPSHVSMGMASMGAVPGFAEGAGMAFPNIGIPQVPAQRVLMGGNIYHITVDVPPNANMADVGRVTVEAIRQFEKRSGNSWRS